MCVIVDVMMFLSLRMPYITTSNQHFRPAIPETAVLLECSAHFLRLINANASTNQPEFSPFRPSAELSPEKEPVFLFFLSASWFGISVMGAVD